jgi:hypothetical protein
VPDDLHGARYPDTRPVGLDLHADNAPHGSMLAGPC